MWGEVAPRLFVGDASTTPSAEHFDALVTLCRDAPEPVGLAAGEHMRWLIPDVATPPPNVEHLRDVVAWVLTRWRAGKRVLVRCQLGLNRSALVVGCALVEAGYPPADALDALRAARGSFVLHNPTFRALVLDALGHACPTPPSRVRWGAHGAAGLLIRRWWAPDATYRFLVLRRSRWTHHGGTWGIPGGALLDGETPWQAALRETEEEGVGIAEHHVLREHVASDDDGWTYTTYVLDAAALPSVELSSEHSAHRWITRDEGHELELHPDLALAWDELTYHRCPPSSVELLPRRGHAWRVFALDEQTSELRPPTRTSDPIPAPVWPARCATGARHSRPPAPGCSCGIYCVDSLDKLGWWYARHVQLSRIGLVARDNVVSRVTLLGDVRGIDNALSRGLDDPPGTLRAQAVKIAGPIFLPRCYARHADALAARYGCAVSVDDAPSWLNATTEQLEQLVAAHGLRPLDHVDYRRVAS